MKPERLLKFTVPVIVLLSSMSLVFKDGALTSVGKVTYYTSITMPFLLIMSVALAVRVALTYERELRLAFLLISSYLAVLAVGNLKPFWPIIYGWSPFSSLLFDALASSMLFLSCFYILKVVELRLLTRVEWIILACMLVVSISVVVYPSIIGTMDLHSTIFRLLNVSLVITLLPVLFLYMHQFRGEVRERITFGMVVGGIIMATIADWIYEMVTRTPHEKIALLFQSGSPYDFLLLLAYSTIFLGLFVHVNYEKWSLEEFKSFKLD